MTEQILHFLFHRILKHRANISSAASALELSTDMLLDV